MSSVPRPCPPRAFSWPPFAGSRWGQGHPNSWTQAQKPLEAPAGALARQLAQVTPWRSLLGNGGRW